MNLFTVLMFLGAACQTDWRTICGAKLVEVHDGDTFKVDIPPENGHQLFTKGIDIRIKGIDAPEMDSTDVCEATKAKEARDLLIKVLSKAKKIDLQIATADKYFRINAIPVADGLSVAQQMVDAKLAVGYDGGTKSRIDWCKNPPELKK